MLGVAGIPSALYLLLCIGLPESPRWLLGKRRDRAHGVAVLRMIQPDASPTMINAEADEITRASEAEGHARHFWSRSLRRPILVAFLVAFFNQLSGINAVLYFAPRIFAMAGLSEHAALLQSVGIGAVNAASTFIGLWLIDRIGRRTLLFIGSVGYIASLGLIAWAFFTGRTGIVPLAIFAFIAAHAIGQGTVIWVLISEVFPTQYRAEGQALGSSTHWLFAALITSVFPIAVSLFPPGYIFSFFCGMMILQLIWVKTMVVETKGVSLEHMQERLAGG
jgi:sugar porter (SP) family MFS transporter